MNSKSVEVINQRIRESIDTKEKILKDDDIIEEIQFIANKIQETILTGNKILIAGNGGSASDSLHMAGELLGRFQMERKAYPVTALNADVATLTAVSNDYGFNMVYARQIQGLMHPGDIFIGISTSGNSENIINAVEESKKLGGYNIILTGKDGGSLATLADCAIIVPSDNTARIQESHITIIHIICELVENLIR